MPTSGHGTEITHDDGGDDAASSLNAEPEAIAEAGDDLTMNLASGSVVFLISGVRFKIPKALLQQHSDGFSAMLDMNAGQEEQAITLNDSLNAFRQFRKVLFTPLESCLFGDGKDTARICNLLDLLEVSNKYCASTIEARTLDKLTDLTTAKNVADLEISVRLRILEVATLVGSDSLAEHSRASLLQSMWTHTSSYGDAERETLGFTEVLAFGKKAHDSEMIGAAYYAIMCNGPEWWASHDDIDVLDRRRLTNGMMRCAEKWHDIETEWASEGFGCHLKCAQKRDVFDASLRIQAQRGIEWYDVVGKIKATMSGNSSLRLNSSCEAQIDETVDGVLHRVRSDLYDYFMKKI